MSHGAFIFDINKCVGCMACIVGCSIENHETSHINWREVNTFNSLHHPDLPVFHFSIACNHCQDSPCMDNCPALAYTRDPLTGAIIHHAESCIGCKYCTWTCPYDAPKFNKQTGIVEKCNFCVDRLENGQKPACVDACPVGALSYGEDENTEDALVPGFVDMSIRPSIRLVPLRENTPPTILNLDKSNIKDEFLEEQSKPSSKVNLRNEWSLVPFTLLISAMVGWFSTHVYTGLEFSLHWFIALGSLTILLSSLHLGKKRRAWRSILNLRRSWLSREILSLMLFLISGLLAIQFPNPVTNIMVLIIGISCLVSVEMVYHVFRRNENLNTHSAMALLTGFLVFCLLSNIVVLIGFIIAIKFSLYIYRKIYFIKKSVQWKPGVSAIRLLPLVVALIYIGSPWFPWLESWMVLSLIGIGEIIDRIEYYNEADVPHPKQELFEHLKRLNDAKK